MFKVQKCPFAHLNKYDGTAFDGLPSHECEILRVGRLREDILAMEGSCETLLDWTLQLEGRTRIDLSVEPLVGLNDRTLE